MTDAAAAPAAPLPMFYKNPVPLEPARHGQAGLKSGADFRFAANTNAIPLTASEMPHAARTYPIVFSINAPTVPFAVVGLRDNENLFVNAEGVWRDDSYIPAYVRRYPFIFSEVPEQQRLVLCIDEAAANFEATSAQPLFVDGKPTEGLQRALQFNETFQAHYMDTRSFGEWLDQNNMLEDRTARADIGGGQTFTLRGFKLLNTERARALEDAQVLELHKKGWLPLLHFHLQSLQNWGLLGHLTRTRTGAQPA
ncbi:SapC family protein [Steroidobacter cummioxidans]|uniref:SapC family protein n=1 Tax=Steroidobacter cummioxidans TaxID=1803913 RepID=UPI00137B8168|nr:SapC family protein [Steroidobacter cummioxidans]